MRYVLTASGCEPGAGHKSILCASVPTVKQFASISDICAIGHSDSASERPANGVASRTYCASHSTGGIELQNYPLKGNSNHEHYNQDSPCHRVCRRSLVVAALRWRNGDRDNIRWRDDV